MVTPRTGRPRGRPSWDWRTDPDRFAIAMADALMALGKTEREAVDFAVISFDMTVRRARSMMLDGASFELRSEPGMAATVKGRASTIRQRKNINPVPSGFGEWRKAMGLAFMLAFNPKDKDACALRVLELATEADRLRGKVGIDGQDRQFATFSLIPLIHSPS